SLGVSVMNARATAQGGFAGGKGGWLVSARPGYLDVALKLTEVSDSIKPRYYDLFGKVQYDLGRGGVVALHALHANDSFRYDQSEEPDISSNYRSSYAWLTGDQKVGSRLRVRSVASAGALDWRRRGEKLDQRILAARIRDIRSLHRIAARQDWTFEATPSVMLKWGFEAKRESASYDYFSAVSQRLRDDVDTDAVDTTVSVAAPRGNKTAFYFAPRVRLLPSLTLEVGVRHDRNSLLGESITSPRVNASWQPTARTTVRAAWGRYSQSQQLFGLQAQDGVSGFERAQRAGQKILGVEQVLPFGLTGRIEGYERLLTGSHSEYANVGGDILLFPELSWDRMRIARDGGRDRGLELQLSRSNGGRMDWSASYAIASSLDSVGGRMIPRSFDQRHAVHLDWSLRPASNSWRLSVGAVWHSGWPYTPTILMVDTLENTPTRFSLSVNRAPGELNSRRLRAYHRMDARWTKYFDTRRGRISVFGEVYNLLGSVNARGIWKDVRVVGRGVRVETGEITQWPRLPLAGLSWEF
ncbi:MAG: TonB-dependent receptor, partial [Gemmatimonadaceae bacterium]